MQRMHPAWTLGASAQVNSSPSRHLHAWPGRGMQVRDDVLVGEEGMEAALSEAADVEALLEDDGTPGRALLMLLHALQAALQQALPQ